MSAEDVFDAWKRHRSQAEVPPDFAAGVLARLPPRGHWAGASLRVAACVLAGFACLLRIASVLGLFLPS